MHARINPLEARAASLLSALADENRLRGLRVMPEGMLDFSSNDYLGLARHPLLIARAVEAAQSYGAGARASRLVTGTLALHEQVEARLAKLKGTEAALILNSGFQANSGLLASLLDPALHGARKPVVLADKLIHASMYAGVRESGAELARFRHNDLSHLESLLQKYARPDYVRFILTESVFSMDGDVAPLAELSALARSHDAFFYVDEAHATGVLGPDGAGLAKASDADMIMGTFSKALGGFGAYVCCSQLWRDYFINRCGAFIYSTALPPAVLGAMDAALELLPSLDKERARVQAHAERFRAHCRALGLDVGASATQIVPLIVGDAGRAVDLSRALEAAGILVVAIRPPTVPPGGARLRFAFSAAHSEDDVARLCAEVTRLCG